ncbi:MAG: GNAT family N-acetyltransferase [Clostridium sp.]|nr:GNAT family N-acetyltransferase [Clostridium sp.]
MAISLQNRKNQRTSFKAIPIAAVKTNINNISKEIQLYKLTPDDIPFAKKMTSKIKMQKLCPDEKNTRCFKEWKSIICNAVKNIQYENNVVILATQDKRPCGIISYMNSALNSFFVESLATWPIKPNQKVKMSGKALMRNLLKDAISKNKERIWLMPSEITPGGKSCMDFYERLGFGFDGCYMALDGGKTQFSKRAAQLDNNFKYNEIKNGKKTKLSSILTLTFDDTQLEKIGKKIKETFKQ